MTLYYDLFLVYCYTFGAAYSDVIGYSVTILFLLLVMDVFILFLGINSLNMYLQYEYSLFVNMIRVKAVPWPC